MKALKFDVFFHYIQSEMIKVCTNFSDKKAEKIYVYTCCEDSLTYSDCFFYINNELMKKHKLEKSLKKQSELLEHLLNLNVMLQMLCGYSNHEMPTEIKIIHDLNNYNTQTIIKYDKQFDYEKLRGSDIIFEEWFNEIKTMIG